MWLSAAALGLVAALGPAGHENEHSWLRRTSPFTAPGLVLVLVLVDCWLVAKSVLWPAYNGDHEVRVVRYAAGKDGSDTSGGRMPKDPIGCPGCGGTLFCCEQLLDRQQHQACGYSRPANPTAPAPTGGWANEEEYGAAHSSEVRCAALCVSLPFSAKTARFLVLQYWNDQNRPEYIAAKETQARPPLRCSTPPTRWP